MDEKERWTEEKDGRKRRMDRRERWMEEKDEWKRRMDGREGWMEEKDGWKRRMDGREGWMEEKDGCLGTETAKPCCVVEGPYPSESKALCGCAAAVVWHTRYEEAS